VAGVWPGLLGLHVYAAHDSQASLRNWIADQYNGTVNGTVTFTADRGHAGNGTTGYIDTGFAGNTAHANWGQDNATIGAYVNVAGGTAAFPMGQAATLNTFINPRNGAGNTQGRNHSTGTVTIADPVGTRLGLTCAYRNASGTGGLTRNGSDLGTASSFSTTMNASNLSVGMGNATFATDRIALAFWGKAFTGAEIAAIYAAALAYLTAIGAN
jgi:hypothetical protein